MAAKTAPNLYQLSGERFGVTYSTTSIDGKPRFTFKKGRQTLNFSREKEALVAGDSAALKRFAISHASPRSAGLKRARNTCQKPEANDGNDDWDFHE